MGYNTTLVLLNDALDQIRRDPDVGGKIADAVLRASIPGRVMRPEPGVFVRAGGYLNAVQVVETHHAEEVVVVAVGGNIGWVLGHARYGTPRQVLAELADSMGYRLSKKPQAKGAK